MLVGDRIDTVEWDYPTFHLSMECYWCQVLQGSLTLVEAEDSLWLTREQLRRVPWLPADRTLIETIAGQMGPG